ncbi:MAG: ABC transporter permease subunit, partial [Candidatus Thiodiazotropha taylori]
MQLVSDKRLLSRLPFRTNGWSLGVISIALLLAVPVLVVLGYLFEPAGEVWEHLAATVLQDYVINSLLLMVGVAIGVLLLGVSTAWLTSMCQFPGRWLFEWALLLPMAIPAYIIAYTYTGLFDFAGPVQTLLRELTGWGYGDYWFPEIRSIEGAALMLALVLYPYVYLLSRAAFMGQSICVLDVSRTLGNGPWRTFFMVALPLARPAIVAGLSLALMETLADYGTVQYFGVSTFTTGIFRTWYGLNNAAAAAQLSAMLLLVVFTLILIEKGSRRQARYHHTTQRHQSLTRFQLTRLQSFMA